MFFLSVRARNKLFPQLCLYRFGSSFFWRSCELWIGLFLKEKWWNFWFGSSLKLSEIVRVLLTLLLLLLLCLLCLLDFLDLALLNWVKKFEVDLPFVSTWDILWPMLPSKTKLCFWPHFSSKLFLILAFLLESLPIDNLDFFVFLLLDFDLDLECFLLLLLLLDL